MFNALRQPQSKCQNNPTQKLREFFLSYNLPCQGVFCFGCQGRRLDDCFHPQLQSQHVPWTMPEKLKKQQNSRKLRKELTCVHKISSPIKVATH